MAGVTAAVVDVAMTQHVLPRLQRSVEKKTIFLKIAQRAEANDLTGSSVIVKMQMGDSAGIQAMSAAGGVFPAATENTYKEHTVPLVEMLGTVSCTDRDMKRAMSSKHSMVKLLNDEYSALLRQFMLQLNNAFYKGTSGTMATVVSFASGSPATVTVDSTRMLHPKMVIDFRRSSADVTNAVSITVTAITGATTFTGTISGTPAAGDVVCLADSQGNFPQGLDVIISATESLQGVAATVGYWWQSTMAGDAAALENFNPLTYSNWLVEMGDRRGQESLDGLTLLAHPFAAQAIVWLMLGKRSYINTDAGNAKFELLWDSFTINGQRIVVDYAATKNRLYAVEKEDLLFGNLGDNIVDLVTGDGSGQRLIIDQATGRPTNAWQKNVTSYVQLAAKRRERHGMYHFYGTDDANATYASYGGTQL